MITTGPRPEPATFDLYATVLEMAYRTDKNWPSVLRASAAWISAPFPVQAIRGAS